MLNMRLPVFSTVSNWLKLPSVVVLTIPLGRKVGDAWKCLSEFAVPIRAGRIALRERTALSEIQDRETWRRCREER